MQLWGWKARMRKSGLRSPEVDSSAQRSVRMYVAQRSAAFLSDASILTISAALSLLLLRICYTLFHAFMQVHAVATLYSL